MKLHLTVSVCVVVVLSMLSGCSTQPLAPETANVVPADRVYQKVIPAHPNPASVTFVRDAGFMGSGLYQHVSMNGERLASIDVGERLDLRLDPGTYVFGVIPTDAFANYTEQTTESTIEAGKRYFFRVMMDQSFVSRIQRYFPVGSVSTMTEKR